MLALHVNLEGDFLRGTVRAQRAPERPLPSVGPLMAGQVGLAGKHLAAEFTREERRRRHHRGPLLLHDLRDCFHGF